MDRSRILVLEKSEVVANIISGVFSRCGYEVVIVCSVAEGLLQLESGKHHLVIMDISMDGFARINEYCCRIPEISLIAASATFQFTASYEAKLAAAMIGADGALPIPFTPGDLIDVVTQAMGRVKKVARPSPAN